MNVLDVEVVLKRNNVKNGLSLINVCTSFLRHMKHVRPGAIISKFDENSQEFLHDNVKHIIIGDYVQTPSVLGSLIDVSEVELNIFFYTLDENGAQYEKIDDESGDSVVLSTQYMLPSEEIFGIWENLIYDDDIKQKLLNYAQSMMLFSEKGVDHKTISCNRVILLHGPPGTGKTSLCEALAQKLSIRMEDTYKRAVLLEVNSHSLFSKWFSESGKLVMQMFSKIVEILDDPETLVCVLIDEVESLAHARDKCMSGNEPSDSMRVVNTLLTQIDQLKKHPNVLILATSNLTDTIDVAFVDRADIKQYIGLPSWEAIYKIYLSCIQELIRAGIVYGTETIQTDLATLENLENSEGYNDNKTLMKLSQKSVGLSGRMLRKIPFLAHALFLNGQRQVTLNQYYNAMFKAVMNEKEERKHFEKLS